MRGFHALGVSFDGSGSSSPAPLAAGYYVRQGATAATKPAPTSANFVTTTAKMDDNLAGDHNSSETQAVGAALSLCFLQILFVAGSEATYTGYAASVFKGPGTVVTADYWNGTAWGDFTGGDWVPGFVEQWHDETHNPTDRSTSYILLTVECTSDGSQTEIRVGDFRPSL
jgi:hypothetical protein